MLSYINKSLNSYFLLDSSPTRRKPGSSSNKNSDRHRSPLAKRAQNRHDSESDQSPPRKKTLKGGASDSDQSPPRMRSKTRQGSDSDQSPPRRRQHGGKDSDEDLSPPRRPGQSQVSKLKVYAVLYDFMCFTLLYMCCVKSIRHMQFFFFLLRVQGCFLVGKQV